MCLSPLARCSFHLGNKFGPPLPRPTSALWRQFGFELRWECLLSQVLCLSREPCLGGCAGENRASADSLGHQGPWVPAPWAGTHTHTHTHTHTCSHSHLPALTSAIWILVQVHSRASITSVSRLMRQIPSGRCSTKSSQ